MFEVANSPLKMSTKTSPMAKIKAKTKRESAGIPVAITSAPIIPTAVDMVRYAPASMERKA